MKTAKSAPKKSPKKAPKSFKISASEVTFNLKISAEGLEPIFGAAYLLTDRAFVSLEGDRAKSIKVQLRLKRTTPGALKKLAETFINELETQKVRWAIAKNNLPIREYVAEQAVLLANGKLPPTDAAQPASEELNDEQRREIEKLIAEVEDEIKTMNQKKINSDPKNIKASWEEKQEKPVTGK